MTTAYSHARAAFAKYSAMEKQLPVDEPSAVQVQLARWESRNFGATSVGKSALGVAEEVGELSDAVAALASASGRLCHAALKQEQRIRGMHDPEVARKAIADAIADIAIFATQAATAIRCDFWTLYREVADEILKREWKKDEVKP